MGLIGVRFRLTHDSVASKINWNLTPISRGFDGWVQRSSKLTTRLGVMGRDWQLST